MNAGSVYDEIDQLVARKKYGKASQLLSERIQQAPGDPRLRLRLADVLILAGQGPQAVKMLEGLVNEYARAGLFAKAIATLKKMQRVDPQRKDLERVLAELVKRREKAEQNSAPLPPGGPSAPSPPPAPSSPVAQTGVPAAPAPSEENVILLSMEEEMAALQAVQGSREVKVFQGSTLFSNFSGDQLEALIGGLRLTSVEPGEILVSEGEPGDSLFLLASGCVRIYVRNPSGRHKHIRILRQGDFFGEISLLHGTPRTATITAATPCEVLELDRRTVNSIARQHPQVLAIIEEFCRQRAGSAEETHARST